VKRETMKWLLMSIPLFVLLGGALWLAFLGHDVAVTSRTFGTVLIHPRGAPKPATCSEMQQVVSRTQDIIDAAQQRVAGLQNAALQFDQKYQHPDYTRFWSETGHAQSEEDWKRVHDEENQTRGNIDKLVGSLEAIRVSCQILP
jgi:hypothetical protein